MAEIIKFLIPFSQFISYSVPVVLTLVVLGKDYYINKELSLKLKEEDPQVI